MIELTLDEFRGLFAGYEVVRTAEDGDPICPYCGNALSPKALGYWNGATEAGTDFCTVEIDCDVCGRFIWRGASWYPGIETGKELLEVAAETFADRFDGIARAFSRAEDGA